VIAGRAPLYGLCASGEDGVVRALDILHDEALNEMAQMGVPSLDRLNRDILVRRDRLPLRPS
jgi:(S)-mandelate dehydrogenase